MNPYVLMLQADADDEYITESSLKEMNSPLSIKYLQDAGDIASFISENGIPAIILLNDGGTITERGQTLRRLKAHSSFNYIPVVVLGERSSPDYVRECYRAGASTFITKPSSVEATNEKIRKFFSYWFEVAEVCVIG